MPQSLVEPVRKLTVDSARRLLAARNGGRSMCFGSSVVRRYALISGPLAAAIVVAVSLQACSSRHGFDDAGVTGDDAAAASTGDDAYGPLFDAGFDNYANCRMCSTDFHSVLDCKGNVVETCTGTDGCDPSALVCQNACSIAVAAQQSVGCEYYATYMDQNRGEHNSCFAVFVANTWNVPAHIAVDYAGAKLDPTGYARIPNGSGTLVAYDPFDSTQGIPPGSVVILFLVGNTGPIASGAAPCPTPTAMTAGVMLFGQTGKGDAFHITSDVPVVAYEMNPY